MDLMGVLEPPVENTTCTASVRRQGVTYLVARMVPAALSVVIGWLYVDAFVLKGANLIVKRADLLPTRGFSPPYVLLRVYGLILAAPYWANAYLLCRAAGFFGEKARQQRHEKTRVAMLYERYFGYDGTLFVWKIFAFQIFEVALQSYGKIPLFLIWSSPFDCLRATCTKSFGKAMSEGRSASFLHAFVIFFYAALLVNVLYPTFLLRTPVWKSTSASGAPDNSSLSHFSAMARPSWLDQAVRNRHRHAIEQASRRWRGGRRDDSARTRRKILISTQADAARLLSAELLLYC
jgi:hypothetical protein